MSRLLSLLLLCLVFHSAVSQPVVLSGIIRNSRLEPLPLVSVQVRETNIGTVSQADGRYSVTLEAGVYDIIFTMVGYRSQVIHLAISKATVQNIILETEEGKNLEEVTVRGKARDRSEEIVRQVIRNKENILAASGSFSCKAYIRAVQEDSVRPKSGRQPIKKDSSATEAWLQRMSMMEIVVQYDHEQSGKVREERTGVVKRGNPEGLFFLTLTDGDFNLYNNLLQTRISQVPFLSPVSYAGLAAYRYKMGNIRTEGGRKVYTIQFRGRQLSNVTVQGELTVVDSLWVITDAHFSLPSFHIPGYDRVDVQLRYEKTGNQAWMVRQLKLDYFSRHGQGRLSGTTSVDFSSFELNKDFPARYFGPEVSATGAEAYRRDSSYWQQMRTTPLSPRELRFIQYRDSVTRVMNSKPYLDSIDRETNRVTWKKLLLFGQTRYRRDRERTWTFPPLISLIQPISFGGARLNLYTWYSRQSPSKKTLSVNADLSYGFRNRDVNGSLQLSRMYNPFNRAYYRVEVKRDFEFIYQEDAWINAIKRNNYYLDNSFGLGHGRELTNGLFLSVDLTMALRRSLAGYKTGTGIDSLIGNILPDDAANNKAPAFEPYNALYGKIRLQYTPGQRYIREPAEKIILGSKWPTFFAMWRKGIPGIGASHVDFDYLEFGAEQELRLRTAGISSYQVKTGEFLNTRKLELVDYQFQRRGDPYLFLNPSQAFQALDSTFPVFKRFYQGHYLHEFNGALLNKIPLLKKLGLREIAGGGFLIAPERNLRYGELFAGVERVFKWPFNPIYRLKLGVYIVGSAANQFSNPVQLKFGIMSWDRKRNRWI